VIDEERKIRYYPFSQGFLKLTSAILQDKYPLDHAKELGDEQLALTLIAELLEICQATEKNVSDSSQQYSSYYRSQAEEEIQLGFLDQRNRIKYYSALFGLYQNCVSKFVSNPHKQRLSYSKVGVSMEHGHFLLMLVEALNKSNIKQHVEYALKLRPENNLEKNSNLVQLLNRFNLGGGRIANALEIELSNSVKIFSEEDGAEIKGMILKGLNLLSTIFTLTHSYAILMQNKEISELSHHTQEHFSSQLDVVRQYYKSIIDDYRINIRRKRLREDEMSVEETLFGYIGYERQSGN